MSTPIASPPNAVAISFLQKSGHTIAFLDWMLVAVPLAVGMTLFTWLVLWRFFAPTTHGLRLAHFNERLTGRGWFVVIVFAITVLLWMTDLWHGLPPALVALLLVVVLTTTGIIDHEDLARLEWSILILISGGISLGTGMQLTGLDQAVAQWLPATGESGFWLLVVLVMATLVVGTFMSNTAAANLFLPIGLSSAAIFDAPGGLYPIQVAMSIALAASMSMALPISTPPNALAYASGEVASRDLARVAFAIGALAVPAIVLGSGWVLRFWGLPK